MQLINLRQYTPENPTLPDALYLIDEQGFDWYASQKDFTLLYKLAIDTQTGLIRSIDTDVSRLFPVQMSVVEVSELPEGCTVLNAVDGAWMFDGNAVVPMPQQEKNDSPQELMNKTYILQCAADTGTATAEQLSELAELKRKIAASLKG